MEVLIAEREREVREGAAHKETSETNVASHAVKRRMEEWKK